MTYHIFLTLEQKGWSKKTIQELWALHRKYDKQYIDKLHPKYIQEVASFLCQNGLEADLGLLIAEELACLYLDNYEHGLNGQRASDRLSQLCRLKSAVIECQKALFALDRTTISDLNYEIEGPFDEKLPQGFDSNRIKIACEYLNVDEDANCFEINPCKITELRIIESSCKLLLDELQNKDHGGPVSHEFDSSGSKARKNLVIHTRMTLRRLNLPYGSQKGGPLARMIGLIHQAAFGTEARWADRYAAMGPKLSHSGHKEV